MGRRKSDNTSRNSTPENARANASFDTELDSAGVGNGADVEPILGLSLTDELPIRQLLTKRQVADILQICEKGVQRRIENEGLPAYKIGNSVRVRPEELEAWIVANRTSHSTDTPQRQRRRFNAQPMGLRELLDD